MSDEAAGAGILAMYSEYRQRSPARKDPFYGDRIPILPALRTRGGFCVPFLRAGDTRPNKQDPASEENVGEGLGPPKKIPHQCADWIRDDKDTAPHCHFESSAHAGEKSLFEKERIFFPFFLFLQKKEWEKKENSDQVSLRFAGAPPAAESTGQARCRVAPVEQGTLNRQTR